MKEIIRNTYKLQKKYAKLIKDSNLEDNISIIKSSTNNTSNIISNPINIELKYILISKFLLNIIIK